MTCKTWLTKSPLRLKSYHYVTCQSSWQVLTIQALNLDENSNIVALIDKRCQGNWWAASWSHHASMLPKNHLATKTELKYILIKVDVIDNYPYWLIRRFAQGENFVHDDPKGPDIRFGGAHRWKDRLWSHPLDRQVGCCSFAIVVLAHNVSFIIRRDNKFKNSCKLHRYCSLVYRASPKSDIFITLSLVTSTFLAAKSRWMHPLANHQSKINHLSQVERLKKAIMSPEMNSMPLAMSKHIFSIIFKSMVLGMVKEMGLS